MRVAHLDTPCLLLDADRMDANVSRLQAHLARLGVALRPHVKTCKSIEAARGLLATPAGPITVSTLQEAEQFFAHGVTDILYAVGIEPGKLDRVLRLREQGADLTVIVDSVEAAQAVAARGAGLPALLEIDCDGHRAGIPPASPLLIDVAGALSQGGEVRGVMTHAGSSYQCTDTDAIRAVAEVERRAVVDSAAVLRAAGFPAPVVSVGSTPTATFAADLTGVTEVRAGVFVFQDLVMAGLGVCAVEDIALSVLVSVIGHQAEKGWLLTDGGWMALSRDRGAAGRLGNVGYGLVCDEAGETIPDLAVLEVNQEHGIVGQRGDEPFDVSAYPVGTRLRILPNHACATAAQHEAYHVLRQGAAEIARWPRFGGW